MSAETDGLRRLVLHARSLLDETTLKVGPPQPGHRWADQDVSRYAAHVLAVNVLQLVADSIKDAT